jgi:hypothetical protein
MPALTTLDRTRHETHVCAMCDCLTEGCDGVICHGLDAD